MIAKIELLDDPEQTCYVVELDEVDPKKPKLIVDQDINKALDIQDQKTARKIKKTFKKIIRNQKAKDLKPYIVFIEKEAKK